MESGSIITISWQEIAPALNLVCLSRNNIEKKDRTGYALDAKSQAHNSNAAWDPCRLQCIPAASAVAIHGIKRSSPPRRRAASATRSAPGGDGHTLTTRKAVSTLGDAMLPGVGISSA